MTLRRPALNDIQAISDLQGLDSFCHGHSASVPVNGTTGLPVGLMLTGRRFDDATVLRAAHAYQQHG